MNANGGDCQHRFTRAENRLIPPLTKVQECNVVLCHISNWWERKKKKKKAERVNEEFIYIFKVEGQLSPEILLLDPLQSRRARCEMKCEFTCHPF